MTAPFLLTRIKYACNESIDWDLIWMQYQFQRGLNMIAISDRQRTMYACNLVHWGLYMLAMLKIVLESRDYDF